MAPSRPCHMFFSCQSASVMHKPACTECSVHVVVYIRVQCDTS